MAWQNDWKNEMCLIMTGMAATIKGTALTCLVWLLFEKGAVYVHILFI